MRTPPGLPEKTAGAGFTLVELLLAVVLIVLLAGAGILGFDSLQRGTQLDDGADQLESLLRFARARAASDGRKVRITWKEADLSTALTTNGALALSVEWEPNPAEEPGKFAPLPEAHAYVVQILEQLELRRFHWGERPSPEMAPGSGAANPESSTAADSNLSANLPPTPGETESSDQAVCFHPDGSSDSCEWIVASPGETAGRRMLLTLSGLTGSVRRRLLASEEAPDPSANPLAAPAARP